MALGLFKLTQPQRKYLAMCFSLVSLIQITLGVGMTVSSLVVYLKLSPVLPQEKAEIAFAFIVIGMYGTHVIFHYLLGFKICAKCYWQAHKLRKSTSSLLLLWLCAGTNTIINLIILSCLSGKLNKHITSALENSLKSSLKNYLLDLNSKQYMDKLQFILQCCGIFTFEDWHKTAWLTKYHVDEKSDLIVQFRTSQDVLTLPVTPWSCCKLDFPMPCLHDPLQQTEFSHIWIDEPNLVTDSLNTEGCLKEIQSPISTTINAVIVACSIIAILHFCMFLMGRVLYTSCRNAVLLGDPEGVAPGWVFGRGDCGINLGKTLDEIMQKYERVVVKKDLQKLVEEQEVDETLLDLEQTPRRSFIE